MGVEDGMRVGVEVKIGALPAALSAISWVRLDTLRVSSFAVPTAVSPVVAYRDWNISAGLPLLEAVFFRS